MKVKSESEISQSYQTLRNRTDCSPPGSSVHGIFKARVLQWGAIAFSVLELTPPKDILFIIGDWNAKVGSQETPE